MIKTYPEVKSTQDTLRELFFAGELTTPFDAVLTEHQTHGRGRNGHIWEEPAGTSLLSSTLVVYNHPPHLISFVAALAAREVVTEFAPASPVRTQDERESARESGAQDGGGAHENSATRKLNARVSNFPVRIKWPNDILVDLDAGSAKIAGVISEHLDERDGVAYFSVGFGLNLLQTKVQLPTQTAIPATSLRLLAQSAGESSIADARSIYARFRVHLEHFLQLKPDELKAELERHLYPLAQVLVQPVGAKAYEADVLGLSADLALRVSKSNGETVEIISADVKPLPALKHSSQS